MMDLESRGIVYPCTENKVANQLCGYCEADLRLFLHVQILVFLMMWLK